MNWLGISVTVAGIFVLLFGCLAYAGFATNMDDCWEDEHISSLSAKVELKSKWDDEDVDENEIKDSWEEDDEPAQPPVVKPASEKPTNKAAEEGVAKEGKAIEAPKESSMEEALDHIAEKLRQQRLVEEADYQSTVELFGGKTDEKNLHLISESDLTSEKPVYDLHDELL